MLRVKKPNVLFVCNHNSARSQMAEAFLKQIGGEQVAAYSAGLRAGTLNPLVVEAMGELGIDISENSSKSVGDPTIAGRAYDYVVTVCEADAESCPIVPTHGARIAWHFPDPSGFTGSREQRLAAVREVRDALHAQVERWARETLSLNA